MNSFYQYSLSPYNELSLVTTMYHDYYFFTGFSNIPAMNKRTNFRKTSFIEKDIRTFFFATGD